MTLRALIFDVDGTLADTERDGHRPAFNKAFADAGLKWHWSPDFYGSLLQVTGGKERIRHYAEKHDPATFKRADFDELLNRLHAAKSAYYKELLASGAIRLRADIGQLICDARSDGLKLAIASSSTKDHIVGLLKANLGPGADEWFAVIASGDLKTAKKPAPDLYQHVLTELKIPPKDCLAVEDSAHGLAASQAAGIPTVITLSGYTAGEQFHGARLVLEQQDSLSLEQLRLWHATAVNA